MYYKCVINVYLGKVSEGKIGVEKWISPSKSLLTLLQKDPLDTQTVGIFMCFYNGLAHLCWYNES